MKFYLFILVLAAISCAPQRRFTRLIEKHPYLLTTDSVQLVDTVRVVVPEVKVDTVVQVDRLHDTITIQKDQLTVRVWMKGDSVYVQGESDTVIVDRIINRTIPVKYYAKQEKGFVWKFFLMGVSITFFLLFLVYLVYKYYLNKR
jgi:D-hexose-6-phosphate mutarotase